MALAALKLFEDSLAPVPLPAVAGTTGSVIDEFARSVSSFEQSVASRVTNLIRRKSEGARELADIVAQNPSDETRAQAIRAAAELIEVLSGIIAKQQADLEAGRKVMDEKIANSAAVDPAGARRLRKLQKRILEAQTSFIDEIVASYYFFMALRSDFDKDARGGPGFRNANELAAYLRDQIDA